MDKTFKKTIKLVSELLDAAEYKHFNNQKAECHDVCVKGDLVTFVFDNDFIIFFECKKLLNTTVLKYIHDIINVYLKALNTIKDSNCLSPIATHELKGMLASAKLAVEMLTKYDFDSEDRSKLLNQTYKSISKTIDIFEEMLQIERLQHQKNDGTIEIEELDIIDMIKKNIDVLAPEINSRNLDIQMDKNRKQIIKGNSFWLDRAIFNLINNAIKYNIDDGYIKIDVISKNKFITIKIQNSSLGIDNNEKEKLFDMFTTTKNSEHVGTGIGLALVKAVADSHGGQIQLQNFENGDVAFILDLPLIYHKTTIQNPYATFAAAFVAIVFGMSYFFPIIPTLNDTQTNGKFDIIKTQNGSIIRIESDADYSFWNFRNLTNSKTYKRLSLSSGYAEAELSGDTVNFIMPNINFTNLGTKVAFEKDKNNAVSIYEGAVNSANTTIEEGFGFVANEDGSLKTAQLLDAPYGVRFENLPNGFLNITAHAIKGASAYKFIIAKDVKFENIIDLYISPTPNTKTKINKDGYYYIKVMAIDQNSINGYQNIVKYKNIYNILKAQEMIKIRDFDKALEFAKRSNKDFEKKDLEPYSMLGRIYYLKGEYAKSIQMLNIALKFKKDNEIDLIYIARNYFFVKDLDRSEDIYLSLLLKNDKNQDALWGLAEVYIEKEQIIQAKDVLEKLFSINPKYYMLNYDMARIAIIEGKKDKAVEYLQKEIDIYPNESGDAIKMLHDIQSGKI